MSKSVLDQAVAQIDQIFTKHNKLAREEIEANLPQILLGAMGLSSALPQTQAPLVDLKAAVKQAAQNVAKRGRPAAKQKAETASKKVEASGDAPKRRGRPPGSKNVPKIETPAANGEATKRRGRPPGSKNKPKDVEVKAETSIIPAANLSDMSFEALKARAKGNSEAEQN